MYATAMTGAACTALHLQNAARTAHSGFAVARSRVEGKREGDE